MRQTLNIKHNHHGAVLRSEPLQSFAQPDLQLTQISFGVRRLRADQRGVQRCFLGRGAERRASPLGWKRACVQTDRLSFTAAPEEINRHVYRDGMNPSRKLCGASETG